MTSMPDNERELFEELSAWILAESAGTPALDPTSGDLDKSERMSDERMAELTELVISRGRRLQSRTPRRRRKRRIAVGTAIAVALTATTAVGALVLSREQPTNPAAGSACRAEAKKDASALVIPLTDDPVAYCRSAWDSGSLKKFGIDSPPKSLTACINGQGVIEVFPGTESVCAQLGLSLADTNLNPENRRIVELNDRIISEINETDCLSAEEAESTARRILNDIGLDDWTVRINADAVGADCAWAGIGDDNHHVFIMKLR
ncbi:MAG: hypothetical protein WBA45_06695 [Microthrixaceae bacterium]